jgi:dTDP-4-dehydrorhamnose reductase
VAAIVDALRQGRTARVFEDRTVSPTYVPDAAKATRLLIEGALPSGLYNCVNTGACTWAEFAMEIARLLDVPPALERVRMAEVSLRAARPLYCVLSNRKLASVGVDMPTWEDALARHLRSQQGSSHST